MRIKDFTDTIRHLTDPFNIPEARRMIAENPALTQEQFKAGGIVEPGVVHHDSRVGYRTGKTIRGSTIAMQEPVEFYVNIIRKMVSDNKYVPPVNINPREVGKIPNFLKAKELVKAETGESFDVLYDRNIQKRKKIKRALDPKKKEMDLISMAERKGRRRALKVDPSDPVKITDRERALNFEQRKYNKNLNLKIRQNPDIILKDKALMDKLSTTVSKDGNIIKVKPTLDDIKKRGIIEVEHQRDIFKKGKLKDLPYNRNFILGPYNREGGFKKMAETFIEKNPDANNAKVKNIIKKAEELGVTLQPDVPKGTFPTKGVGYKQVGGPVEKFANAAEHAFKGSTFEQKILKTQNISIDKIENIKLIRNQLNKGVVNFAKKIEGTPAAKQLGLKLAKKNAGKFMSRAIALGLGAELAAELAFAVPGYAAGKSVPLLLGESIFGVFGAGRTFNEELARYADPKAKEIIDLQEDMSKLQRQAAVIGASEAGLEGETELQERIMPKLEKEAKSFYEREHILKDPVYTAAYEKALAKLQKDEEERAKSLSRKAMSKVVEAIKTPFIEGIKDVGQSPGLFKSGGRVSYLDGGIVSLLKK